MLAPFSQTSPDLRRSLPVTRVNRVDFPVPFGPMKPEARALDRPKLTSLVTFSDPA